MNDVNPSEQFLFTEKYRPQTIDDCIIPDALKKTFNDMLAQGELPNLLLSGTAGTGKTTAARALARALGADLLFINASMENGIDVLRTKIAQFASSVSLSGGPKIVLLDEADNLTTAVQPALRGFIEEFSANCRFIFTCNFKNRIIEPLHSRCACIDFKITAADKQAMLGGFFKRCAKILKTEGVEFDQPVVAELITKHFPDYRRILNELQHYSVSGKIDSGILLNTSQDSYKELIAMLKSKDFVGVRKWVGKNSDSDTTSLFRTLYDMSSTALAPESVPQLILILADYQYKAAFVVDHELNIMAALTEIMAGCKFI